VKALVRIKRLCNVCKKCIYAGFWYELVYNSFSEVGTVAKHVMTPGI